MTGLFAFQRVAGRCEATGNRYVSSSEFPAETPMPCLQQAVG